MNKFFIIINLCILPLLAEQVKIIADSFEGNEKKGITIFKGNVQIIKGNDELNASLVAVHTDKERKPIKYEAKRKGLFLY